MPAPLDESWFLGLTWTEVVGNSQPAAPLLSQAEIQGSALLNRLWIGDPQGTMKGGAERAGAPVSPQPLWVFPPSKNKAKL